MMSYQHHTSHFHPSSPLANHTTNPYEALLSHTHSTVDSVSLVSSNSSGSDSYDESSPYRGASPAPTRPDPPTYTRQMTRHTEEADTTYLWGYAMLLGTFCMFVLSMYSIVVSKFVPNTGHRLLDAISNDGYYCLLIPLTLPVTIYFIFWNWMGMKTFRHAPNAETAKPDPESTNKSSVDKPSLVEKTSGGVERKP